VELGRFDEIDMLFTDLAPPPEFTERLEQNGVELVIAA
jgi:DeoR/GlpR family transcriptional regulator of sugar metabolism